MKIDLHIHTKTGSDGNLSVEEVFQEAKKRNINLMSITDHDSIDSQERAIALAKEYGIIYITGVELNVTFQYPGSKSTSLDFLGYQYDIGNQELKNGLQLIREHRETRVRQILEKLMPSSIKRISQDSPRKTSKIYRIVSMVPLVNPYS
ncbi:MAG: PHP domain-containing protein [Dehalococcoidales bacterium]|nr:PHP domain-containing protein [Dehalococcoidales bacterium]